MFCVSYVTNEQTRIVCSNVAVYKDGEILTFKPAHKKSVSNVSFCPIVYRFVDLSV